MKRRVYSIACFKLKRFRTFLAPLTDFPNVSTILLKFTEAIMHIDEVDITCTTGLMNH